MQSTEILISYLVFIAIGFKDNFFLAYSSS